MKKSYSTRVFLLLLSLGVQNADAGFTPKEFLKHIRPLATAAVLGCAGVGCTNGGGQIYDQLSGTPVWVNSRQYDSHYGGVIDLMGPATIVRGHRNYVTIRVFENEWTYRDVNVPYSAIHSKPKPWMVQKWKGGY